MTPKKDWYAVKQPTNIFLNKSELFEIEQVLHSTVCK